MIDLIKIVDILNETKGNMGCELLEPICTLNAGDLRFGYMVEVNGMGVMKRVNHLSEREINSLRFYLDVIEKKCINTILEMKEKVNGA